MSLCRSCGAKIEWVVSSAGKSMPVDPEHIDFSDADDGDVLITDEGKVFKIDHNQDYGDRTGRISHFSTCPQANKWRKKK